MLPFIQLFIKNSVDLIETEIQSFHRWKVRHKF